MAAHVVDLVALAAIRPILLDHALRRLSRVTRRTRRATAHNDDARERASRECTRADAAHGMRTVPGRGARTQCTMGERLAPPARMRAGGAEREREHKTRGRHGTQGDTERADERRERSEASADAIQASRDLATLTA